MILNTERKELINSHRVIKGGQQVLAWNIATLVMGLCRSGGRSCRNCDCQARITRVGGNTIEGEYTPVEALPTIRKALEAMAD